MIYEIIVQLKREVLDPEGRAIHETLGRLGCATLKDVAVSKRYVLTISEDEHKPDMLAENIAREYLANPVSETYQIRKL